MEKGQWMEKKTKSKADEPIRVLQVFAALDSGGVSNYVMNLYREIDTDKVQFDFAMTAGEKSLYDEEVLARGGRIFYFDTKQSLIANLRSILREQGPFHAVHSHVFFYSGLVLAQARKAHVPIRIAHAHNAHTGESRSPARLAYETGMQGLIRLHATHLLGCSGKACRYVFGKGIMRDPRAAVIPDGINCGRFAYNPVERDRIRQEYGLTDRYVIGHVGHFNPAKNHEKILTVFREVCRHRENAALLLVGEGELETDVRNKVTEMGLAEKVIFAGAHKNVERYYQAMDVFLFPSRYEGFGMAMVEAQASGLACVASDVVPRETNVDGRAVYLSLEEKDSLWAERLLQAPARRTEAFEKICEKFEAAKVAQDIVRIYSS